MSIFLLLMDGGQVLAAKVSEVRELDLHISTWTVKTGHVGNTDQRRIKRILLQHQRETSNQSKIRITPTPLVFC